MIQMLRKRLDRKDEGFTLIELMVVVLIIAILLAIAIPTFLGARSRAQNRAAESDLRNALTASKTGFTDTQSYYPAGAALDSIEPSLSFLASGTAPAAGTNQVEVILPDTTNPGFAVCLIGKSASGNLYGVFDVAQTDSTYTSSGTFYGSGSSLACPADAAGTSSATSGDQWGATTALGGW